MSAKRTAEFRNLLDCFKVFLRLQRMVVELQESERHDAKARLLQVWDNRVFFLAFNAMLVLCCEGLGAGSLCMKVACKEDLRELIFGGNCGVFLLLSFLYAAFSHSVWDSGSCLYSWLVNHIF